VNSRASVHADEKLRLFCALRLPDGTLDAVVRWQQDHVTAGRLVPRENLHLTLAFLGRTPASAVDGIVSELRGAAGAAPDPIVLQPVRYREGRSVGMLVLSDAGGRGAALADDLHGRLERLGVYRREARPWLPHLTVVRFRERPRLRPPLPDLGSFSPSDAAAYLSVLRPTGAEYVVLESAVLGGN
jgi:2'-5' RNA ligase